MINNDDNIIICRCEDVTLAEVKKAIADGHSTIDDIKRATRAGMGPCHGGTCGSLIAQELARRTDASMENIIIPVSRPLTKPVKLSSFAVMYDDGRMGDTEAVQSGLPSEPDGAEGGF